MPVFRYRSVAEMPASPALAPAAADSLRAAWEISLLCYRLRPWRFPPGVHRHHSVEELESVRGAWDAAAVAPGSTG